MRREAAAFDPLTRSNRDGELVQQSPNDWAITEWDKLFETVDVIATPTFVGGFPQLVATNLTGHPAVILPHGFRPDGTPVSLTFLGALYGEARLLAVAQAYQRATNFHLRRPMP